MGLLAYDPNRIHALRSRLAVAMGELHRVGAARGGPDAAPARRAMLILENSLRPWVLAVERVATDDSMCRAPVARLDRTDIAQWSYVALIDGHGWQIADDPLTGFGPMTTVEARALGEFLADPNGRLDPNQPDQLADLHRRLAVIANDPTLSAAFLEGLGPEGLVGLLDDLAALEKVYASESRRQPGLAAPSIEARSTLSAVARMLQPQVDRQGCPPAFFAGVDPYTAALVMQYLVLDQEQLVTYATQVLQRESAWPIGQGVVPRLEGVPNTYDLVYTRVARNPAASYEIALLAVGEPLLLGRAYDRGTEQLLLLKAANPAFVSPEQAEPIVIATVNFVLDHGLGHVADTTAPEWPAFLGGFIAPHLLYFTARADEWAWGGGDPVATAQSRLEDIVRNGAAREALIARSDDIITSLQSVELIVDGDLDEHALGEFASLIAGLHAALLREEVDRAASERFLAGLIVDLVVIGGGSLIGGPVAGIAFDVAATFALEPTLRAVGVLPSTEEDVQAQAEDRYADTIEQAAATAIRVIALQLLAQGQVSIPFVVGLETAIDDAGSDPTPAQLRRSIDDFLTDYAAAHPDQEEAVEDVGLALATFLNPTTDHTL